jgi:hypothetical protein
MIPDPARSVGRQVGRGALNLLVTLALLVLITALLRGRIPNLAGLMLSAGVALAAYLAGSRWIERRPPPELNGRGSLPEFAAGLALGCLLFSTVMGLLALVGVYHPLYPGAMRSLPAGGVVALSAAVVEEVLVRGFIFRVLSLATGTWIALLLSAALFGALHAFNPGATVFSSIAIALEAGVLLAAAYVVTGRLWLPIGLHAAWNFTEGSVFGMSVSGGRQAPSLFGGTLSGPATLTGGAFGPEASIVAVAVCLALALLLLRRAVRSGRIARPPWTRETPPAASNDQPVL